MPEFSQWLAEEVDSVHTVTAYVSGVQMYAAWFQSRYGRPLTPAELTGADVRDYKREMEEQKRAAATINLRLAALRAWVRWAMDTGELDHDPLRKIKGKRKQKQGPKSLDRVDQLRVEREVELLVGGDWYMAERNAAIMAMFLHTALRVSELCALDVGDVQLSERKGTVVVRRGKCDKEREVPLNAEARDALRAWIVKRGSSECPALFIGKRGERLEPRGVQRLVAQIGRRAGVEMSPHTLRHTCAIELLNTGAPLPHVKESHPC